MHFSFSLLLSLAWAMTVARAEASAKSSSALSERDLEFTHYVTFDISVGDEDAGQLKFGLYGRVVPKTVENFYQLSKGTTEVQGAKRAYAGSIFHRVIKQFMIQGGDITKGYGRRM